MSMTQNIDALNQHYLEEIKRNIELKKNKKKGAGKKKVVKPPNENITSLDETNTSGHKNEKVDKKKVEVVVFKTKKKSTQELTGKMDDENYINEKSHVEQKTFKSKELLNKLHWDVKSFSLKGATKGDKRKMEEARAIKLGAKPRKREYINYKVLMEQRKKQKLDNPEENKKKRLEKRTQVKNTVFWTDSPSAPKLGKIGKYKDGILKLKRRDLKSIEMIT